MIEDVMEDAPMALMAQQASSSSGPSKSGASNIPWVEKYRPKELTQVSHHKEIVSTLQNAVETNRLPHLLFYGPPGTGKTSVALALCRTLYSPDQLRNRVLELNASDERGISVVRDKIKGFASLAVGETGPSTGVSKGKTPVGMGYFAKKRAEQEAAKKAAAGGDDDTAGTAKEPEKIYPNPPYKIIILDEADTVTTDAQSALRRIIVSKSCSIIGAESY
jgi:replication factor C subunit 2/4